ncbi:MAG: FAD-dependent thymidylate synthase, partial [Anaerolineaceae bacterium]|nr:FAD-dependent thymidylate synthase [Anaerolineaceae bacterium]
MSHERQIYLLNPRQLSPETIAVTFAKTSRSPESFREIAAELTDEKSAQFHEKWVVGYGHASVAEHAVLHIAIENVSRLAIESIESNRLASYTEKSTRYQKWTPEAYYIPAELDNPELRQLYTDTCRDLFATYNQALPMVRAAVQQELPRQEAESDAAWDRRIRSQYIDVCRFLLPAASLANVGMTANARVLEHAVQKMLSDPLQEVRSTGEEIKRVAREEVPTLVKYADRSDYLVETSSALEARAKTLGTLSSSEDWCRLVSFDPQGEQRVLASALYRFGGMDYSHTLAAVENLDGAGRERLAAEILSRLARFEIPLRELEHSTYSFELMVDQGAYFEIKRHRMMTQTPQELTASLGFATPRRMEAAGLVEEYCRAMQAA